MNSNEYFEQRHELLSHLRAIEIMILSDQYNAAFMRIVHEQLNPVLARVRRLGLARLDAPAAPTLHTQPDADQDSGATVGTQPVAPVVREL